MSTTRRRRIRAHREGLRAGRAERRRPVDARVEQMHRLDEAMAKRFAWAAFAVFFLLLAVIVLAG